MPGGVGGEESQDSPLSRLKRGFALSTNIKCDIFPLVPGSYRTSQPRRVQTPTGTPSRLAIQSISQEGPMKPIKSSMIAASAAAMTLAKITLVAAVFVALAPAPVQGQQIEKKGTTPYVTHFIFRPLHSLDVSDLGTATVLEAVG